MKGDYQNLCSNIKVILDSFDSSKLTFGCFPCSSGVRASFQTKVGGSNPPLLILNFTYFSRLYSLLFLFYLFSILFLSFLYLLDKWFVILAVLGRFPCCYSPLQSFAVHLTVRASLVVYTFAAMPLVSISEDVGNFFILAHVFRLPLCFLT